MLTPLRSRSLALAAALTLGLLGSALGPACLVPDYCIVIVSHGTDWCTQMEGALMWPPGQPELAEPVFLSDGSQPRTCVCMNDGEDEILFDRLPPQEYAALVSEIELTARETCVSLVLPGYEHNCLELVDGVDIAAPSFQQVVQGESNSECIGTCVYTNAPPFGSCGPDPDPWECNGEDSPGSGETGGTGETGGSGETGGGAGVGPIFDGRSAQ